MNAKRWVADPHPEGRSLHLEPHKWSEGVRPSYYLDQEFHTKAAAETLARRLNEHAELLEAMKDARRLILDFVDDSAIGAYLDKMDEVIARAEAP